MKTLVFTLAIALSLSSCHGQEKKEKKQDNDGASKHELAEQKPRGSWKVNREVDDQGNLIRYDSIYTYSYGNINGEKVAPKDVDSTIAAFHKYMEEYMPRDFFRNDMIAPFEVDSLRASFFESGVFENNWEQFFPDVQHQLQRMDSLHQRFFQKTQPGLFPLETESNKKKEKM